MVVGRTFDPCPAKPPSTISMIFLSYHNYAVFLSNPYTTTHGSESGGALACGTCKSCSRHGFESQVKRASQFKTSLTPVSTTERYFTLSVVCLIVECARRQRKGNSKRNIQIVGGLLGWKWIERAVLQLLHIQKEVELLLLYFLLFIIILTYHNTYTSDCSVDALMRSRMFLCHPIPI